MRDISSWRRTNRNRLALFAVLLAAACQRDAPTTPAFSASASVRRDVISTTDNVVLIWDAAALQAIRTTKPGPTVVARSLAVLHTSIFDAWAAYDSRALGTQFGGTLRRPAPGG